MYLNSQISLMFAKGTNIFLHLKTDNFTEGKKMT